MKRIVAALVVASAVLAFVHATAWTAPKPSEVQVAWQLEIDYKAPQAIQVQIPGESQCRTYWYMRYTITNRTGAERFFVPQFVLYTDTGKVYPAGKDVPTAVFATIKELHNDPLMRTMTGMAGQILQGDDNAKEGVVIWPDFDPQAGQVDIFISGLSGETAEVELPNPVMVQEIDVRGQTKEVEKKTVVLRKTLSLRYAVPGEAAARLRSPVKLLKQEWVMR